MLVGVSAVFVPPNVRVRLVSPGPRLGFCIRGNGGGEGGEALPGREWGGEKGGKMTCVFDLVTSTGLGPSGLGTAIRPANTFLFVLVDTLSLKGRFDRFN